MESMHGWGISERIEWLSDETFTVNQGSLYPALQRLQTSSSAGSPPRSPPVGRRESIHWWR